MQKFREALIFKLCRTFTNEEVQTILDQVDAVLVDYELKAKEVLPAVGSEELYAKKYFETKHMEGMSKASLKVYASELKDFYKKVGKPLISVTTQDIRDYLIMKKTNENTSDRSLEHRRVAINSFYEWMEDNHYVERNPAKGLKRIKFRKTVRQPLSSKELDQIRYVCRNNLRSAALIEFAYSTGCRISEINNVKISDIDFYSKEVKVLGKGNKERIVYLNTAAENAIKRYLDNRKIESEYLFTHVKNMENDQISTDALRDIFKEIGEKAGLNRVLHPHDMRHTTATDALKRGMPVEDVQSYLGHTKLDTTMIYIKLDKQRVKINHQKCFS